MVPPRIDLTFGKGASSGLDSQMGIPSNGRIAKGVLRSQKWVIQIRITHIVRTVESTVVGSLENLRGEGRIMELKEKLERLFVKTARAHHETFKEVGTDREDWAVWYAEEMSGELAEITGGRIDQDDLVEALNRMDERYRQEEPSVPWPRWYADYYSMHYLTE